MVIAKVRIHRQNQRNQHGVALLADVYSKLIHRQNQ